MLNMRLILESKFTLLSPIRFLIMVIWLIGCTQPCISYARNLAALDKLIGNSDAVLVADPQGKVLFQKNADRPLVPASTLKLLTALVALHHLGPEYRFATKFYLDQAHNLKIKGYGDPLLISEVLQKIAQTLAEHLNTDSNRINDLVLDDSYFNDPLVIPGVSSSYEPYDAPNGALCVNFNTVYFKRQNGTYISAESQTPLLPFVLPRIQASKLQHGRIVLARTDNESTLYAGHLLSYFLKQQGIHVDGKIRIGRVQKQTDKLIFRYVSEFPVVQIISKLLEHSNNFIANQLLIAVGAQIYGAPGTLAKGVRAESNFAEQTLKITGMHIVEGSGISRENRVSAQSMFTILVAFQPYHYLMQRDGRVSYKTGTLSGICTRAGYIENKDGDLLRFVVLVNTAEKSVDDIMDVMLKNIE